MYPNYRRTTAQRGMILLLTLALLTTFSLLIVGFMFATSHMRRTAESSAAITYKDLEDLSNAAPGTTVLPGSASLKEAMQEAISTLLVGRKVDDASASVLIHQSLLESLYGHPVVNNNDFLTGMFPAINLSNPYNPVTSGRDTFIGNNLLVIPVASLNGNPIFSDLLDPANGPGGEYSLLDIMGNVLTIDASTSGYKPKLNDVQLNELRRFLHDRSVRILMCCPEGQLLPPAFRDAFLVGSGAGRPFDDNLLAKQDCFIIHFPFDELPTALQAIPDGSNHAEKVRLLLSGCQFIINGAPFRGAGVGFDIAGAPTADQPQLNLAYGNNPMTMPVALAPNPLGIESDGTRTFLEAVLKGRSGANLTRLLRMNVDYTAPDVNNMFLGWYNFNAQGDLLDIIPSFHRPDLIQHWDGPSGGSLTSPLALHRLVLRPLPILHPEFSGSNAGLDPAINPHLRDATNMTDLITVLKALPNEPGSAYDFDSDSDGVRETFWMDIGLPVETDNITGQEYKPLVGILVRDLDSRINLNAHGQRLELDMRRYATGEEYDSVFAADATLKNLSITENGNNTARGEGVGPAEISILNMLESIDNTVGLGILERLLGAQNSNNNMGRYSSGSNDNEPNVPNQIDNNLRDELQVVLAAYPFDGTPPVWEYDANGKPGAARTIPVSAFDGDADLCENFNGDAFGGRLLDLWGWEPQSIDFLGNGVSLLSSSTDSHYYWGSRNGWDIEKGLPRTTVMLNNPYAFDPNREISSVDKPFTGAELETLLRLNDLDVSSLPPRLLQIFADADFANILSINESTRKNLVRRLRKTQEHVTTLSNDVPSQPGFIAPDAPSIFTQVLKCVGGDVDHATVILKRLPPELLQGMKVDLNRLTRTPGVLNPRTYNAASGWTYDPGIYQQGLIERVRFAEQIFLLLVVLSYDELYATGAYTGDTKLGDDSTLNSPERKRQWMIARLAQWAVNLVDYIDPDDSSTPLLVYLDPFNTATPINWQNAIRAEDLLTGANNARTAAQNGTDGSSHPMALFWGMERPSLVISETLALHNRRTADTNQETDVPEDNKRVVNEIPSGSDTWERDKTYDQVAPPEPSLFIELYNVGLRNRPNGGVVNFATRANNNGGTEPMWRLVVGKRKDKSQNTGKGLDDECKDNLFWQLEPTSSNGLKLTHSLQPKQSLTDTAQRSNILGASIAQNNDEIEIDRIIWLGKADSLQPDCSYTWQDFDSVSTINKTLEPNEYLVVGPREDTYLATKKGSWNTPASSQCPKALTIRLNGTEMINAKNLPWKNVESGTNSFINVGTEFKQPKFAIVQDKNNAGVNISGPLPNHAKAADYYKGSGNFPKTTPFDLTDDFGSPLEEDDIYGDGVVIAYKPLFLQRLADPLRPYDEITNPYITVDYTMLDLAVYSGDEGDDEGKSSTKPKSLSWNEEKKDFKDDVALDFKGTGNNEFRFSARQLGLGGEYRNLWNRCYKTATEWRKLPARESIANLLTADESGSDSFRNGFPGINHGKSVTFGYLNQEDSAAIYPMPRYGNASIADDTHPLHKVLQQYGESSDMSNQLKYIYAGAPWNHSAGLAGARPFRVPAWNDAPLASAYDALNVPASAPGRFGLEYMWYMDGNVYNDQGVLGANSKIPGHLLNFFHSALFDGSSHHSLNLARFFDFAGLPSKFVGTAKVLHHPTSSENFLTYASTYREPGKVNLNTITEPEWQALVGDTNMPKNANDLFTDFNNVLNDGSSSFLIPSPFRAASASTLSGVAARDPVDTTLLRPTASGDPLLSNAMNASNIDRKTFNTRNLYHPMARLSEMTTSRSNVFAVWITVGRFAVSRQYANYNDWRSEYPDPNDPTKPTGWVTSNIYSALYPDGRMLKHEIGSDGQGEVLRRRAFLLIDRSIPVGFRRGEKYNSENVILYQQILE